MHLLIDKKIKIYFYLILFLLFSTFYNLNLETYFKNKFKITNIENQNNNVTIYDLSYLISNNIFNLDKQDLIDKLKNNPILSSYEIKKIYPNSLRIQLIKSNPIAKILKNENYIYLGDNGKIFHFSEVNHSIPEIKGKINLKYINRIIKIINQSSFKLNKIKVIEIYPSNRFDLKLNKNNIIKFPHNVDLKFMENAFMFFKNNNIYNKTIDLRIKNKIIISHE